MKKQKMYVIREKAFFYGDDFYYPTDQYLSTEIIHYDKERVMKLYNELERDAYRRTSQGEYDDNLRFYNDSEENIEALIDYFHIHFKEVDIENDFIIEIPEYATDEQVDKIRELFNFNFYELLEYEGRGTKFVWHLNPLFGELEEEYNNSFEAHTLKETKRDAIPEILFAFGTSTFGIPALNDELNIKKAIKGLTGKLNIISETPHLLQHFLDHAKHFNYDFDNQKIYSKDLGITEAGFISKEMLAEAQQLFELLKVKPYIIKEVPIE